MPAPIAFEYDGRSFEVRALADSNKWVVRVFEGNRPATAIKYSIDYVTEADASFQGIEEASVHGLMRLARQDIESGLVRVLPQT